jgi:hypothetical protein
MKVILLVVGVFAALAVIGCDLFNEAFLLTATVEELAVQGGLTPGSTVVSEFEIVDLNASIPEDFRSDIVGAGVYDIRIRVKGDHPGQTITGGVGSINGIPAVSFGGNWNDYLVERSVLTDPNLTAIPAGINELISSLLMEPLPIVSVSVGATLGNPAAAGDTVIVALYSQVNASFSP